MCVGCESRATFAGDTRPWPCVAIACARAGNCTPRASPACRCPFVDGARAGKLTFIPKFAASVVSTPPFMAAFPSAQHHSHDGRSECCAGRVGHGGDIVVDEQPISMQTHKYEKSLTSFRSCSSWLAGLNAEPSSSSNLRYSSSRSCLSLLLAVLVVGAACW